jgi:hypothetical protein
VPVTIAFQDDREMEKAMAIWDLEAEKKKMKGGKKDGERVWS